MGVFKTALYSALIIGSAFGGYQVTSQFTEKYFKSLQESNHKLIEQSQIGIESRIYIDPLPARKVDFLVVNTANIERTYANKSEQEGVVDLQRLVTQTEYEEAWIYIPQEQKWVEVGYEESDVSIGDNRTLGVTIDKREMNRLIQKYGQLVEYHIHPYTANARENDKKEAIKGLQLIPEPAILEQVAINVGGGQKVFPSANDLSCMVTWSRNFYRHHSQGDISFKIVSPFGVTQYQLTKEGHQLFTVNLPQLRQVLNQAVSLSNTFGSRILNNAVCLISYDCILEQITKTCQDMSTSHYTIRFTPFEQKVEKVMKPLLYKTKKKGKR